MTNADKFKGIFGIYATELWSKSYKEFSDWLNEDVPDTNVGDTISIQAAIDAIDKYIGTFDAIDRNYLDGLRKAKSLLYNLPSAKRNKTCEFWDSESSFCALNRPSAQRTGIILTPCEGGADMAIGAEMAKGEDDETD